MDDKLLRLMIPTGNIRIQAVTLQETWRKIKDRHPLLDAAPLGLLGEMSAASALLSASLKYEGSVTLQIHGDGPVRLAVAECNAEQGIRATIDLAQEEPKPLSPTSEPTGLREMVNQSGLGRFSLILDPKQPNQQPYQGIVSFTGESLADAIESYMSQSEQLPSRLWLFCDGEKAAGLLLQQMPDTEEEAWQTACMLASTVEPQEMLKEPLQDVLHKLFWEMSARLLEERTPRFECPCTRARVGRMLNTLGIEEVESILEEQGEVEVRCNFCNWAYRFDAVDCARLFNDPLGVAEQTTRPGPTTRQ